MSRSEPVTAAEYTYTVLFQPEPEGGFTVACPTLPGLVTYGETVEEARATAAEAVGYYLESLRKDRLLIPESVLLGRPVPSLSASGSRSHEPSGCRRARGMMSCAPLSAAASASTT